jgi:acetylornithine deacetylase/succinyl-diaminopimelate desuccinylase
MQDAYSMSSPHRDEMRIIDLLVDLVKAPSYPGVPRQEEAVVHVLRDYLKAHGIETVITEVQEGRPNLLATVEGSQAGPHILFCGHTDTVPPNVQSSVDPFAAVEKDGTLYGRGTVDMKGAIAAMAGALARLKRSGEMTTGKVTLGAVIDEEMQSLGAEALILGGFRADAAVVGEPTNNQIAIGHKGLEWLEVELEGRAAHGGTPSAGISAISAAAHFIHLVETELVRRRSTQHGGCALSDPAGPSLGYHREHRAGFRRPRDLARESAGGEARIEDFPCENAGGHGDDDPRAAHHRSGTCSGKVVAKGPG